ncbi:MAG: TIGR00341 family protein [Gammaproteobacteria bacterium]|nr:TIGR00341 family protein [Gammaproteobacteria bacterium]
MRIIEVLADCGHADTIRSIAEQNEILECWIDRSEEETRCSMRLLVRPEKQQAVLDAVQSALSGSESWRVLIKPVEAIIPRPAELEEAEKKSAGIRLREELYQSIEAGGRINSNFIWLVILSTIVASIGLIEDNVAVVIGAMVIAPLLGPNIALAFGAALGDRVLLLRALQTNLVGMGLALALSFLIGSLWPANLASHELLARTDVGLDSVALALASGAAAVLSLTTGLSSALVGVMVAVALLPPTATFGLTLAAGHYHLALGASLLLLVNVVSVNLAAKLVLIFKGVKPRTWLEKQKARQSVWAYVVFWVVTLLLLLAAIQVYHAFYQQAQ